MRYNELLLKVLYFPIMLFAIAVYIGVSIALIPFGYIWAIVFKINIMFKDLQISKQKMLIEIVFFTIFGPIMLSISFFVDFYWFCR